jgi:hypothetical protein
MRVSSAAPLAAANRLSAGHPSGAKARNHRGNIRVAEPGESRNYTTWPADFSKKIGDA